ncbi:MAG: hypothetical protein ACKOX4_02265, partial [Bacteroidota bacterium]
ALDHHIKMLAAMQHLDLSACQSRGDLDTALRDDIPELSTRMFVLKNIERDEQGRFRWRIALGPLSLSLSSIGSALPPQPPMDLPALLVRGEKSNYVTEEDWQAFLERFPHAEFHTVPGAGHWVHADPPISCCRYCFNSWTNIRLHPWTNPVLNPEFQKQNDATTPSQANACCGMPCDRYGGRWLGGGQG